jgi:hypothetical protein
MRDVKVSRLDGRVQTEYFMTENEANRFCFIATAKTHHMMKVEPIMNVRNETVYRVRDVD